ncbi:MAG TPA: sulfotransferase [Rhizomicrobium sp.]
MTVDSFSSAAKALRPDRSRWHRGLGEVAALLEKKQTGAATKLLQEFLQHHPRDANALHLMADIAVQQGRLENAVLLLARCVELTPDSIAARYSFANALVQTHRPGAALLQAEELLKREPQNPVLRWLKALALEGEDDFAGALAIWRALIEDYPGRPDCWLRYGHALRAMGLGDECVAAYRKVLELYPSFGGAWWGLADLKTFHFGETDIEQMERQLARGDLSADDRTGLHFALGTAYADAQLYEKSFANFARGNAIRRLEFTHDPGLLTNYVARCKRTFTAELFRDRAGCGSDSTDPIFVVGMPRSGSTLVEQILASHSQIEGTRELFDLAALSRHVQSEFASRHGVGYPEVLSKLDATDLRRLGGRYLESVGIHRKRARPIFVDKMGPNFVHIGMLQLILPNAKIVDVRRHPVACGLSIFMQLFPKGQNDAYRLSDIGCAYRDYVELMAHFDRVLPGKVHRVFYESLVGEPESAVRRLLDHLGLPFEPACLNFYETQRVVTTSSSEQVRRPIYRDALEHWRHYEPWLGPLARSLGSVLEAYPSVPVDMG